MELRNASVKLPADLHQQIKDELEAKNITMSQFFEMAAKEHFDKEKGGKTMANVISDETMEYVGILAKLELSEEEKAAAKKDMESMLDYIDKLNELDTSGVEPMSHVFPVHNVFREDVVTNGDGGEDTLANAPERRDRAFVVPKTVDQ